MATPVVWLPLNGDLKNQGTFGNNIPITNNGATVNTNGKIGSCYYFNGSAYITGPMDYSSFITAWSITLWFKVDSAPSSWATICNIGKANGFANEFTNIVLNGSNLYVVVANGSTSNTSTFGIAYTAGSWHHIAFIYKNRNLTLWLDGVQKKTQTISFDPAPAGSTHFALGASYNNAERLTGYLNDIRIYNEELSPKEIKEISQCLVLHYPLNHIPQQNLLSGNINDKSAWTADGVILTQDNESLKLVASSGSMRIYNSVAAPTWQSGQIYTVSFDAKAAAAGATVRPSRSIADWGGTLTLTANWRHYVTTISSTATPGGGTLSMTISSGATVWLKNIKLEKGNIETPFYLINEPINVIYDTSGFNHNGSLINTPVPTKINNDGRYDVSLNLNGTDQGIQFQSPDFNTFFNNVWTISFWIYSNGENGGRSIYFSSYNASPFWCLEKSAGNAIRYDWNGSIDQYGNGGKIVDGKWNHIVLVKYSNTSCKSYINGVLDKEMTTAVSTLTLNNPIWRIGRDVRTGDGTPYKGNIADFRIYATALSETDIKTLYNTPYSIDNLGQGHGYEYQEGSNLISIQKNGIIKEDELNEIITLSDGSMWLPIMVHDNKSGTNLFSSSDDFTKLVYHNDDCWAEFPLISSAPKPDNSKYEFLVYQRPTDDANFQRFRWTQTNNPLSTTAVTGLTTLEGGTANGGGICKKNSNTYFATGSSNWWNACGCWTKYGTGIPGFNGVTINRELLLFMRVLSNNYRDIKNSFVIGTNFLEI